MCTRHRLLRHNNTLSPIVHFCMLTCLTDADTNRVLLSQALVASLSSLDAALCCCLHVCVAGSAPATTDNNRCVPIDSLCARQHGLQPMPGPRRQRCEWRGRASRESRLQNDSVPRPNLQTRRWVRMGRCLHTKLNPFVHLRKERLRVLLSMRVVCCVQSTDHCTPTNPSHVPHTP